jgi:dTMP kinase
VFLTLEGIDGSGKSTQARLLAERLRADDLDVVLTREPGGTALGEAVRDLVLHGGDVSPWAEAALYAASRAQHVHEVIRPALDRGAVVISDRYVDSSAVYQGVGRGLGLERVLDLNLTAVGGLLPDRTFLLRLAPAAALARMGPSRDRIEREGETFLALVHDAYDALAARFPDRIVVVDASRDSAEIAKEIHGAVRSGS